MSLTPPPENTYYIYAISCTLTYNSVDNFRFSDSYLVPWAGITNSSWVTYFSDGLSTGLPNLIPPDFLTEGNNPKLQLTENTKMIITISNYADSHPYLVSPHARFFIYLTIQNSIGYATIEIPISSSNFNLPGISTIILDEWLLWQQRELLLNTRCSFYLSIYLNGSADIFDIDVKSQFQIPYGYNSVPYTGYNNIYSTLLDYFTTEEISESDIYTGRLTLDSVLISNSTI